MKLPPELLAVIERETKLARIRRSLTDLQAPEAAPRLNAQVRLREEHVEMLKSLLLELDSTRLGAQMAGDNYTFRMPTEELKTEIEELRRNLRLAQSALEQARLNACPDPECPNCKRWRAWEEHHGDVLWLQCLTCKAKIGQPCRHAGEGRGRSSGNGAPVLKRPHRDRPWVEHPREDLV